MKWRCSNFKSIKCSGSVTVEGSSVIKKTKHICTADPLRNEKDRNIACLRKVVKISDEPIPKLYDCTLKKLLNDGKNDVAEHFPELSSVQHSLYSDRNKEAGVRKLSYKLHVEVEVPKKFEDFILADYSSDEGERIIIFCSPDSRQLIGNIKEFFGDATFQSCPAPFSQLYIILGEIDSTEEKTNVKPLIYVLMPDKKEHTYYVMFQMIQSQLKQWNQLKMHCDYEIGAINAIIKVFPDIHIVGCYYHWGKCLWRNAKLLKMDRYKQERRIVALCAALPLLPKDMISKGWEYINSEPAVEIFGMQKLLHYVKKNWLRPKYINFVSVFAERHRTNNVAEGLNAKINKRVHKNTVNLMRLLNVLRDMDTVNNLKLTKTSKKKRNKKLTMNDDVIRHVILELINGDIDIGHALDKLR